jgi:FtsP/CotA-like multicopper oxidase with cupredoxin domain
MSEESIMTENVGEEDRNESSNVAEKPAYTRRNFLQQAAMVASGLAISSQLPSFAKEALFADPQAPICTPVAPGQTLQSIMEIRSSGAGSAKTLKAVMKVVDEEKVYLGPPVAAGTQFSCNTGRMRFFSGYDASVPPANRKVWPTTHGVPSPGPTLRASVGDTVQITLLNHVDVSKFPNGQLDVAEHGQACDSNTTFGAGNTYPGDPSFEHPPNCFHGSSSCNLHFHGSHVSPSSISDNVLITIRPSPRGRDGRPIVNEQYVDAIFNEIFTNCEHGHQPMLWKDWPAEWQKRQQNLLVQYDNTASWMGKSPPPGGHGPSVLPLEEQLWWNDQQQIMANEFPQYYIGAFPNCFTIPKWNGQPDSMGQAPGTHWYHAHKHGSTALNLSNGMAGALIIEGDYDAVLKTYYKNKGQTLAEQVLVLQQFSAVLPLLRPSNVSQTADLVYVNGQYTPVLEMQPNQTQMWRIINACHQAPVPINAPPAGLKWVQTAQDGVQFHELNYNPDPAAPTNQSFPVPAKALKTAEGWVTTGSLAAGNRIDLLVQAPSTPGDYKVTFGGGNKLLLTVRVTGTAVSGVPFPSQNEFPKQPGFLSDIRPPMGMVRREIRFNTTKTQLPIPTPTPPLPGSTGGRNAANAAPPLFPNAPPTHTINGKQFSHKIDQYMTLGATEEWNLFNDTPQGTGAPAHPFHIHINPFQVIAMFDPSYMDASLKETGVPIKEPWVWWDNFALPPGGWAKMWTRFVDYTGTYVFHCHILGHEDRGMMQLVNVSPSATPMKHK